MIKLSKQTKKVLAGILIIICISLLAAYLYYGSKNRSEDPRVVETKYLFKAYEDLMKEKRFDEAIRLMDSVEYIFLNTPGYQSSYELGIVYNNRGSAYLSIALYSNKDSIEKTLLLRLAKMQIDSSIAIYSTWMEKYGELGEEEILNIEKQYFLENDSAFKGKNHRRILKKRVDDLIMAQEETPRRLSVSYTNAGIILRHQFKQKEAAEYYIKAIELWKDNYIARNNFNVLMGKDPEDRSIIDQLFPPDKLKKE
jgi:tetratricopeptide (TPR) repeat protein